MNTINTTGLTNQQMKLWLSLYKSRTVFKLPNIRPAGVRWEVLSFDRRSGSILLREVLSPRPITTVVLDPPIPAACHRSTWTQPILPTRALPPRKPWQTLWLSLVGLVFVATMAVSCQRAQAYELQQCEWLSNQAYSQAWQRDAGVTLQQLKVLVRRSDERPEVQTGLVALGRYVYSHPEMTPNDLADDLLATCRSYDQ